MPRMRATFISMFKEPIFSFTNASIIARAHKQNIIATQIISILERVEFNHHAADDTPYGGGPGELLKISIVAPLIKEALSAHQEIPREHKRVILMDPAGKPFLQSDAQRLAEFQELIFVCGRYEGIDARVHHYVDEALSLGDFVLSAGDVAAMAMFDATARMIPGVLGNWDSSLSESHQQGRLEGSHYTRPALYDGHQVPDVFIGGNHGEIDKARARESLHKTKMLRPDLLEQFPLTRCEIEVLATEENALYPWNKS